MSSFVRTDLDFEDMPAPVVRNKKGVIVKKKAKAVLRKKAAKPFRYFSEADSLFSRSSFATVDECKRAAVKFFGKNYEEPIYIVEVKSVGLPGKIEWKDAA